MQLQPNGSQPLAKGAAEFFTGTVRIDPLFKAPTPARASGACPPGEKHWHGAAPNTPMTHIAIQEELDGKVVDWMEKVTDDQYNGPRDE